MTPAELDRLGWAATALGIEPWRISALRAAMEAPEGVELHVMGAHAHSHAHSYAHAHSHTHRIDPDNIHWGTNLACWHPGCTGKVVGSRSNQKRTVWYCANHQVGVGHVLEHGNYPPEVGTTTEQTDHRRALRSQVIAKCEYCLFSCYGTTAENQTTMARHYKEVHQLG